MILIPEQISYLRQQVSTTRQNLRSYNDYLDSKDITSGDYSARALIGDSVLDNQYEYERQVYNETIYALENADYKTTRNTDIIDIGTKFTIQFDGDEESEEIILVEGLDGLSIRNGFVSLNSLLGQNVIGKKENDRFEYIVVTGTSPRDRRKISGTIKSIKKEQTDYVSFIREKRKNDRISKIYKEKRHELLTTNTEEAKQELENYETISPSQRFLLIVETERLRKNGKDRAAVNRMTVVKRLLQEAKVVHPNQDGTISVGTKFELKLNRDGQIETVNSEMINQAVSEELDCDYIERISPLGQQIYGLKMGDSFTFREGNKSYKGVVSSIDNGYHEQKSLGYQYHK